MTRNGTDPTWLEIALVIWLQTACLPGQRLLLQGISALMPLTNGRIMRCLNQAVGPIQTHRLAVLDWPCTEEAVRLASAAAIMPVSSFRDALVCP